MSENGPEGRAQSHVVGVALLLAITTVSMGALTAGVGTVIESNAAAVDTDRVADSLAAIEPSESTGIHRHELAFGEGRLTVEPRTVRVLDDDGVVAEHRANALVFEAGDRRVTFLAGGVARGSGNASVLDEAPPIATGDGLLLLGLPVLRTGDTVSVGGEGVTATLRTDTSHDRRALGEGAYRLAIETATPGAWADYFAEGNASVRRRTFDGDTYPSVVARFPGERTGYLVLHETELEVET
ncbi:MULTISPECIES: DUF7289 family protein [Halolamina]|uniref:Type IV pilin n=1 Tax=Halolamina pelagica TaxID=699431 RepID=A0A1I5PV32_9EURY|nr:MULTISPECIES: hypothetical protein [Halolamina]NHX34959.1 hypothetical protein [Halolamina sp. R1-12]SFP37804.1 hypothetical protein SAMN05216277_103115 [Halolamina pelagica]